MSATQPPLERVNRVMLKNHLETCFSEAVLAGRGQTADATPVEAVEFNPALTGPEAQLNVMAAGEAARLPRAGSPVIGKVRVQAVAG